MFQRKSAKCNQLTGTLTNKHTLLQPLDITSRNHQDEDSGYWTFQKHEDEDCTIK